MPAFIANRTIMGMVHHEPLDHLSAEIDGFCIHGRNHQAIPDLGHAAHLDAFERDFTLDRANPAGSHGSQSGVIAETRDYDAQPFSRLNDLHPLGSFNFMTVNDEFGHRINKRSAVSI